MAQANIGSIRKMRHKGNWTEENMKEAIKEVKKGTASIAKIGEKYGIAESSIRDWLTGKTSSKKRGPRTVLTKEEEDAMVAWCLEMQRNGHSLTFYMLRRKVADVCQGRETPFKNGVPGKSWMDWFLKRHPSVLIESTHALKGKKRNDTQIVISGQEQRSEAGGSSSESDGSESYPSSGGKRAVVEGIAAIERAIREGEDRKDRRLERQLETNDRIAAGLLGALGQVSESASILVSRGFGGGDLGRALGALGGLGSGFRGHQP